MEKLSTFLILMLFSSMSIFSQSNLNELNLTKGFKNKDMPLLASTILLKKPATLESMNLKPGTALKMGGYGVAAAGLGLFLTGVALMATDDSNPSSDYNSSGSSSNSDQTPATQYDKGLNIGLVGLLVSGGGVIMIIMGQKKKNKARSNSKAKINCTPSGLGFAYCF